MKNEDFLYNDTKEIFELMDKAIDQLETADKVVKLLDPESDNLKYVAKSFRAVTGVMIAHQIAVIHSLQVWLKERDANTKYDIVVSGDIDRLKEQVDKLWSAVNR